MHHGARQAAHAGCTPGRGKSSGKTRTRLCCGAVAVKHVVARIQRNRVGEVAHGVQHAPGAERGVAKRLHRQRNRTRPRAVASAKPSGAYEARALHAAAAAIRSWWSRNVVQATQPSPQQNARANAPCARRSSCFRTLAHSAAAVSKRTGAAHNTRCGAETGPEGGGALLTTGVWRGGTVAAARVGWASRATLSLKFEDGKTAKPMHVPRRWHGRKDVSRTAVYNTARRVTTAARVRRLQLPQHVGSGSRVGAHILRKQGDSTS